MGEKIVVGPINKGLKTDREPFVIDNDSFPTLVNAYQWRGRLKRKRGTSLLGRLQRYIGTTDGSGAITVTINPHPIASGVSQFVIGTDIFTDPGGASPVTLITNGSGAGTLNRSTGVLTITGSQATTQVIFYPQLPVLGLEDLVLNAAQFAGTLGFDQTYAYSIGTAAPYSIHDVSFYKNLPSQSFNSVSYTAKTTWTPVNWNAKDYMQFWSTNYENAFWATSGINVPFDTSLVGMQYKFIATITYVSATNITITITEATQTLVVGDWVFINEVTGTNNASLNLQTGFITAAANNGTTTTLTVRLPYATVANETYSNGILQYLTNSSDTTKDCIRWYDGDPTSGNPAIPTTGFGWVNYAPPLSAGAYSIATDTAAQYYLVGARVIQQFKDRLLFIGPVIQTSAVGSQLYLQDTVIYSQNGVPYYTASFTGSATSGATTFNALLVPANETATANAMFEDGPGPGGFISAGYAQPILTVNNNEDVLILGFTNRFARLVYTSNDLIPFNFYVINSEYGAGSTFSSITLDRGAITFGNYGITLTSQINSQRIDLEIPDSIFQLNYANNGALRICAVRDFINEWVYFTYPSNEVTYNFPNQTLQYNYRDGSWAIFNECFTTYGRFRETSGDTWANLPWSSWAAWNEPWGAGSSTEFMPKVIGGTPMGYILFRDQGTNEGVSVSIQNIVGNLVSAPNHCLNNGDYIVISGATGTVASSVNGKIFSVTGASTSMFSLLPGLGSGLTYTGGGQITRMYIPFIQSKQFPVAWEMGRKTRLGVQQYLLTKTTSGQITLLIFLSQNAENAYNNFGFPETVQIVPENSDNNALVYSTILYTCPESTNLGLTPANTNLQQLNLIGSSGISSNNQAQIWHRMNTSLLGDTIQVGFSLNDSQMRDTGFNSQFAEIEIHGFILDVTPSQLLS